MKLTEFIAKKFAKPDGFTGLVATYVMNRLNQKQYELTKAKLSLEAEDTILEIGFGNGSFLYDISQQPFQYLYGVDISEDMVKVASKKNAVKLSEKKVILTTGTVDNLAFEGDTFDKIFTINTVYFWQDMTTALAEIYRVLKPGGKFFNVFYDKRFLTKLPITKYGFTIYTEDELVELSQKNGLILHELLHEKGIYCLIVEKNLRVSN